MRLHPIVLRVIAGLCLLSLVFMTYSLVMFFVFFSFQKLGITVMILALAYVIGTWFLAEESQYETI